MINSFFITIISFLMLFFVLNYLNVKSKIIELQKESFLVYTVPSYRDNRPTITKSPDCGPCRRCPPYVEPELCAEINMDLYMPIKNKTICSKIKESDWIDNNKYNDLNVIAKNTKDSFDKGKKYILDSIEGSKYIKKYSQEGLNKLSSSDVYTETGLAEDEIKIATKELKNGYDEIEKINKLEIKMLDTRCFSKDDYNKILKDINEKYNNGKKILDEAKLNLIKAQEHGKILTQNENNAEAERKRREEEERKRKEEKERKIREEEKRKKIEEEEQKRKEEERKRKEEERRRKEEERRRKEEERRRKEEERRKREEEQRRRREEEERKKREEEERRKREDEKRRRMEAMKNWKLFYKSINGNVLKNDSRDNSKNSAIVVVIDSNKLKAATNEKGERTNLWALGGGNGQPGLTFESRGYFNPKCTSGRDLISAFLTGTGNGYGGRDFRKEDSWGNNDIIYVISGYKGKSHLFTADKTGKIHFRNENNNCPNEMLVSSNPNLKKFIKQFYIFQTNDKNKKFSFNDIPHEAKN